MSGKRKVLYQSPDYLKKNREIGYRVVSDTEGVFVEKYAGTDALGNERWEAFNYVMRSAVFKETDGSGEVLMKIIADLLPHKD